MSQGHDWDKEWSGLEPEQPRSGRCGCWLGVLVLLLSLLAICGAAGYFAWQQLGIPLEPGALLTQPTIPPLSSPVPVDGAIEPATNPLATPTAVIAPTVTLPGAAAATAPAAPQDIVARRLTTPPIIDGNLAEYADLPAAESQYRVFNVEDWDGSDDVRARWQLGWDDDNLYVAAEVEDDRHVQTQTGSTVFQGDSLSIQIDTERDADYGPRLSPDDYQIELSPGDFAGVPASTYRFRGSEQGEMSDFPGQAIFIATRSVGGGYTVEASIPWSDLGIVPSAGLVLGMALNVNDNDTPGTAVQEVMKSHIASRTFRDPTTWGTLILR